MKKDISRQNSLVALNPFLSHYGIIKWNSELKYAEYLSFDTCYLVCFYVVIGWPMDGNTCKGGKCKWNWSYISKYIKVFLGNASQRSNTKSWKVCYKCRIAECKTTNQVIALFPSLSSLLPFKAFLRVAFDFGEPFLTIQGNDRIQQTYLPLGWLILFFIHTGNVLNWFLRIEEFYWQ